jgi:hypothetical protein
VGDTGELAVALIDFVRLIADDYEERNAVANFGRPNVLLIEAEIDGGL